jgi:hypothetical protein
MKFTTLIALIGVASAVQINGPDAAAIKKEADDKAVEVAASRPRHEGMHSNDPTDVGGNGGQRNGKINEPAPTGNPTGAFSGKYTRPTTTDANDGWQDATTQRFQIKSAQDGNRVLYVARTSIPGAIGVDTTQFRVFTRESEGAANEFWYYHAATGTLRSYANSDFTLDYNHADSKGFANGADMVVRPFDGS